MRLRFASFALLVSLAAAARGQQPAAPAAPTPAPPATPLPTPVTPAVIIYKIELVPTGYMFAANEPVLEGDSYVFIALPEKSVTKLHKSKVKAVSQWSGDYSKEEVWRFELAGATGMYLARNEPVKKGKNWVAYSWKNNTLMSVPEADVVKITRLTGREAFQAEMIALGVVLLEGQTTTSGFKGGNAPVNAPPGSGGSTGGQPEAGGQPAAGGNWMYQGRPGATDAYAPAGGTVSRPGDTPMVPTPR
jgi:hypothetical protein